MIEISEEKWRSQHESRFRNIFGTTDAFDAPLRTDNRTLLFPVPFILDQEQFAAVVQAARLVGDDGILLSITEIDDSGGKMLDIRHWRLEFWDYVSYTELPSVGVLENALYSPSGAWGVLISHEQHAIAGGSGHFVSALCAEWPDCERAEEDFVAYWSEARRRGADVSFLDRLLRHVYGAAEASAIVTKIG